MIRVAIIDDHPLFREGVIRSLSELDDFEVVGEGASADEAIRIAEQRSADILLLDLSMPGGGLNAVGPILVRDPQQKIVVLTVSEAGEDVEAALKAGAKGYVLKGVGSRTLADILRNIAAGESYVAPNLSAALLSRLTVPPPPSEPDLLGTLTSRERQILELVARGLSNKHVALELNLHEKTIKHHMTKVFVKLGVANRTEAALVLHHLRTQAQTDAEDVYQRA